MWRTVVQTLGVALLASTAAWAAAPYLLEGIWSGVQGSHPQDLTPGAPSAAGVHAEGEGEGEGEGETFRGFGSHAADQNGDSRVGLSELLRVIQFYNSAGYHCEAGSEDGYAPGPGATEGCLPHSSDYNAQDWFVRLSELLRLIQFYNSGGYHPCVDGEDGYCPGPPVNVVWILFDAMRADRIGASRNGIPVAPFVTEFAQGGAYFSRATSPSTWTRPAMAALFTGLYPQVFRGVDETPPADRYVIPESYETLAEWLAGYGYDTWAVQTNLGNLSEDQGFTQGYPEGHHTMIDFAPAELVTDTALENLSQWHEPFFTYIHYIDPHVLYNPPAAYQEVFGPRPSLTLSDAFNVSNENYRNFVRDLYLAWVEGRAPTYEPLSANGIEYVQYSYDSEVRYVDDEAARLVAAVQAAFPNTIFIILADHGEALLERGIAGHGLTMYEKETQVPLILRGPGISPAVINHPIETLGILPTLADLLDLPARPQWQSRNLFAYSAATPIFCHSRIAYADTDNEGSSVLLGDLKLIEHNIVGTPQLYNLAQDLEELDDLAAQQPDDVAALQAVMAQHLADIMP